MFIAQLSWRGWVAGARVLLRGEGIVQPFSQSGRPDDADLHPLASDLRALLRDIELSRRSPDREGIWSPEMLRGVLREQLLGDEILVVSNREPFVHVRTDHGITLQRPASGLVTAMEPVMRAFSGTWIAHGSGSADRDTVDEHDRLRVPPDKPAYTLRRVWLTPEEEQGYYYGFANEGLWPLCHIAHVRPVFRTPDWLQYLRVNRRFADAVRAEARTDDPVVLVQDYHFALLPRLVRERMPKATHHHVLAHPWPNPESFGICPWREELLDGMLGSTILGFHTSFHRQNFVETVDRYLEARIERESSTIVVTAAQLTRVEPYPISIQWPPEWIDTQLSVPLCRAKVLGWSNCPTTCSSRSAWTGWITPRGSSSASWPSSACSSCTRNSSAAWCWCRSPRPRVRRSTSTRISKRACALAARVNARFGRDGWQPIRLKVEHHDAPIGQRVLSRRRRVRGHQPARRHEPRREGVRRRPGRRAWRARALAVHRRGARAARRAAGEPVSQRAVRPRACTGR